MLRQGGAGEEGSDVAADVGGCGDGDGRVGGESGADGIGVVANLESRKREVSISSLKIGKRVRSGDVGLAGVGLLYLLGFRVREIDPILHVVAHPQESRLAPQGPFALGVRVQVLEVLDGGNLARIVPHSSILAARNGTGVWNRREDEVLKIIMTCRVGIQRCIHGFAALVDFVLLGDLLSGVDVGWMSCESFEERQPVIRDHEDGCSTL